MKIFSGFIAIFFFVIAGCSNDSGLETSKKHVELHYQCPNKVDPVVVTLDTVNNRISLIIDNWLYTLPGLPQPQHYANLHYRVSIAQHQLTIWQDEHVILAGCSLFTNK